MALALFVLVERRSAGADGAAGDLRRAQFRAANLVTAVVYAALGGVFFLLVVQLQNVLGYSAIEAGAATLPITLMMLALSARSARWRPHRPPAADVGGPAARGAGHPAA